MLNLTLRLPALGIPTLASLGRTLMAWAALHRQHHALGRLTPDQLCDIGVTASDVRVELARAPRGVRIQWKRF